MQVNKQTILEQLEKYENKDDILTSLENCRIGDIWNGNIDILNQFINTIDNINFDLEQNDNGNGGEVYAVITTYQEIRPKISKAIIWEYDANTTFESVDEFAQFIADTHNEIDKVFNN